MADEEKVPEETVGEEEPTGAEGAETIAAAEEAAPTDLCPDSAEEAETETIVAEEETSAAPEETAMAEPADEEEAPEAGEAETTGGEETVAESTDTLGEPVGSD